MAMFEKLQWLSFPYRCTYHTAVLVYKAKNDLAPEYIKKLLIYSSNNTYDLRDTNILNKKLVIPKPRTNYLKATFSYTCVDIWNNVPTSITSMTTLTSFKRNFKKYLKSIMYST